MSSAERGLPNGNASRRQLEWGREQVCRWSPKAHEGIHKRKRWLWTFVSSKENQSQLSTLPNSKTVLNAFYFIPLSLLLFSEGIKEQLGDKGKL